MFSNTQKTHCLTNQVLNLYLYVTYFRSKALLSKPVQFLGLFDVQQLGFCWLHPAGTNTKDVNNPCSDWLPMCTLKHTPSFPKTWLQMVCRSRILYNVSVMSMVQAAHS